MTGTPLGLTSTQRDLWWGAIIGGFVIVLAVAALLTILVVLVRTIDRRVAAVRDTLKAAAANTADTALIADGSGGTTLADGGGTAPPWYAPFCPSSAGSGDGVARLFAGAALAAGARSTAPGVISELPLHPAPSASASHPATIVPALIRPLPRILAHPCPPRSPRTPPPARPARAGGR